MDHYLEVDYCQAQFDVTTIMIVMWLFYWQVNCTSKPDSNGHKTYNCYPMQ